MEYEKDINIHACNRQTWKTWLHTLIVWSRPATSHVASTTHTTSGIDRRVRAATNLQFIYKRMLHNYMKKKIITNWARHLKTYITSSWHVIPTKVWRVHPTNITATIRTCKEKGIHTIINEPYRVTVLIENFLHIEFWKHTSTVTNTLTTTV